MKLGIKIAPDNSWKSNIEATRPQMVEIWYNAGRPDDYNEIFAYLKGKPIDVGLHYWGALPNNILTNITYPDASVNKPSLGLMHAAIDKAAAHNCSYINVHPDVYSLLHVDFTTMTIRVASETADYKTFMAAFIQNFLALSAYARSRGVLLTVETLPMRDTPSWRPDRDRTRVIDIHEVPVDVLIDLSRQGVAIANDLGHTACNMISPDRTAVWEFLKAATRTLAPQTRLIHMGFLAPPYNGVDFHNSLANPVFQTRDAVPNKSEMVELLKKNFRSRDDMWILVEPSRDHVKNYFLARELLEKAGVLTKHQ